MKLEKGEAQKLYVPVTWLVIPLSAAVAMLGTATYLGSSFNEIKAEGRQAEMKRVYLESRVEENKMVIKTVEDSLHSIDIQLSEMNGRLKAIEKRLP